MSESKKHTLSRFDLILISIGQIFGAGILTVMGTAIGITGKSIGLSIIVGTLFILVSMLPVLIVGTTVHLQGGDYGRAKLLLPPLLQGSYILCFLVISLSVSMYGISFASYFQTLIPNISPRILALMVVSVIFAVHSFGVKGVAKFQYASIFLLFAAFGVLIYFGFPRIDFSTFVDSSFMTSGPLGILTAGFFMTFAIGGAQFMVSYTDDARNPKTDIPFAMIFSTLLVSALYIIISFVAVGVLPISVVANQPLTLVSREVLGKGWFEFFIVGGALIGLMSTMNVQVGAIISPVVNASKDGWLPKKLQHVNTKNKTFPYTLALLFVICVIPIIFGIDLSAITTAVLILFNLFNSIFALRTPVIAKVCAEEWSQAKFKMSNRKLKIISIIAFISITFQNMLVIRDADTAIIVFCFAIFALSLILSYFQDKKRKVES